MGGKAISCGFPRYGQWLLYQAAVVAAEEEMAVFAECVHLHISLRVPLVCSGGFWSILIDDGGHD